MIEPPRTGTAGWAIPACEAARFPGEKPVLARYAHRFDAVEINSSFHRPHRRTTYERWAASVPPDFRFAVKLPKTITHQQRLIDCDALLARFADEVAGLGVRRGPLLVQLPPSLQFDAAVAQGFFEQLAARLPGDIVCEPRHASWFGNEAEDCLVRQRIARVAADPAPLAAGMRPGGWRGLAYYRLHGSPRRYWSAYPPETLREWADAVRAAGKPAWVIFDNTAAGSATGDALAFARIAG